MTAEADSFLQSSSLADDASSEPESGNALPQSQRKSFTHKTELR